MYLKSSVLELLGEVRRDFFAFFDRFDRFEVMVERNSS